MVVANELELLITFAQNVGIVATFPPPPSLVDEVVHYCCIGTCNAEQHDPTHIAI